jgi:hypothetical protein
MAAEPLTMARLNEILAAHRDGLRQLGVVGLRVFGSLARGEAREKSDLDLLVEFDRPVGLSHLVRVQLRLQEMLGVEKVDLLTEGGMHPALKERILSEARQVA